MADFESSKWTGENKGYNPITRLLKGRSLKTAAQDSMRWFRNLLNRNRSGFEDDYSLDGNNVRRLPRTREQLLASPSRFKDNRTKKSSGLLIGRMYFFVYDPKHKKTLPYYDTFPLIFPIQYYDDGFLGVNLHYLDIRTRSALFSQLQSLASNQRYNDNTRLKISYNILKGLGDLYKPCVKRYLMSHVRSQFIFIHPSEWEEAIFLPVESFEKAPVSRVWRESRKMV